jgi:hypothetical protein
MTTRLNDDIARALRVHGGEARLQDLYITYGTIRVATGRSLPPTWRASVRERLQTSPAFIHIGRGRWGLA